ncbi:MAG: MerC domain-containing protein [Pseudomonadota bacterium]
MIPKPSSLRRRLDRAGLVVASLCALHCFATIVLVSFLGIGGHFFLAPEIHEIGLLLAIGFAAVAIGSGVVAHRKTGPALFALAGLGVMGAGLMLPHGDGELIATIVGVTLVAYGHVLNLRSSKA